MPDVATLRRVGHKGADLIVPGNTPASFDAALEAGVDMIEFDVLPEDFHAPATSRLVLAHDYSHDLRVAPSLEDGLAHLASPHFADVDLDVDLKLPGYEERVVRALQEFGLVERTLISTQYQESLPRIRALEPRIRLGWSVPKARRDYTDSLLWKLPAYAALAYWWIVLPRRAAAAIRAGEIDAVMTHWRLASRRMVRAVRDAGGEIYVWTVDSAQVIRRFEAMGVTGVISNDPRLFS
jgi:glycerophosphoryl diester phosphodiesterase